MAQFQKANYVAKYHATIALPISDVAQHGWGICANSMLRDSKLEAVSLSESVDRNPCKCA